jgi:hypothetical protein
MNARSQGGLWFLLAIAALLGLKWADEQRQSGIVRYTVADRDAGPRLGFGTGSDSREFRAAARQAIDLDYRADVRRACVLVKVERMEMQRTGGTWERRPVTLRYWKLDRSGRGRFTVTAPADDLYRVSIAAVLVPFAGDVEIHWSIR